MSEALIDLAWIVYWIDVLAVDDFHDGFGLLLGIGLIGLIVLCIIPTKTSLEDCCDDEERWWYSVNPSLRAIFKWFLSIGIAYSIYYTFMPDKETAWTITGIVAAAKVAENPEINKVTGKGMDILNKKLEIYSKKLDEQLGIKSEKGE